MTTTQRDPIPGLLEALARTDDGDTRERLLMEAGQRNPADARIYLLIAGERMQRGNVDGGEAAFIAALHLAPEFHIARFQLGLLQLTSGRPAAATATWALLDLLEEKAPLRLFKEGLLFMAQDRFEEASQRIREGIERNRENAPLDKDMQMVLDRIAKAVSASETGEDSQPASSSSHYLVSSYRRSN